MTEESRLAKSVREAQEQMLKSALGRTQSKFPLEPFG